jgi:signal transduction histidine kinase
MGNKFIVGVIRDITEHKKAQEYLKEANRKLQELDQRKSDFVDNVSHEFRNPLSIIKESLGLLLDRIVGDINPKQEDLILTARSNINRLIRLVTDLLDIAKIESGKMSLAREQVDIIKLVKEIVSGYALEIAKKQLIYKEDIQPDAGFIWADRDKLTEVVINLLNNAIKYTSCGGTITVKLSGTDDEIRFEVRDTGSGIPKEYMDKIFDKFERIASERQEGTGLGLPIAKGIVDLHHGKIWVESQPGQGSSFIVVLPRDLRKDG